MSTLLLKGYRVHRVQGTGGWGGVLLKGVWHMGH